MGKLLVTIASFFAGMVGKSAAEKGFDKVVDKIKNIKGGTK